jgi:hypothetical protein
MEDALKALKKLRDQDEETRIQIRNFYQTRENLIWNDRKEMTLHRSNLHKFTVDEKYYGYHDIFIIDQGEAHF